MEIEQFVRYIKNARLKQNNNHTELRLQSNMDNTHKTILHKNNTKTVSVEFYNTMSLSIFETELLYYLFANSQKIHDYSNYHECEAGKRFIENIKEIKVCDMLSKTYV